MSVRSPRTRFVQASFRLHPDTHQAIRDLAAAKNTSHSDIARSAIQLLKHTESLPDNIKLAAVDVNDSDGQDKFKVVSWLVVE